MRNFGLPFFVLTIALSFGASDPLPGRDRDPAASAQRGTVVRQDGTRLNAGVPRLGTGTILPASCENVGAGNPSNFPLANRLRGNVYQITTPGLLRRYSVELVFRGEETLYFTVLRRPTLTLDEVPEGYQRAMDDIVLTVEGVGRSFYGTGELATPLTLEAGYDYFMGVGWGSPFIDTPRNEVAGDQPFSHGVITGLVSLVLTENEPPIEVPQPAGLSFVVINTGAYSMELCFEPEVGACCCAGPTGCLQLLETECAAAGGFFAGERTPCNNEVCQCGACCAPCGECLNDFTQTACETGRRGTWQGLDSQCADEAVACPVVTGACCVPSASPPFVEVVELCIDECEARGGVYHGDGVPIAPNPCVGACCVEGDPDLEQFGFCLDRTLSACALIGGTYAGDATNCATLPPEDRCGGACCWGIGDPPSLCQRVSDRTDCTDIGPFLNPHYLGDATSCPSSCSEVVTNPNLNLVFGACCLSDSVCMVTTASYCLNSWNDATQQSVSVGVYLGDGTDCTFGVCSQIDVGACCGVDDAGLPGAGSCTLLTEPECINAGGSFGGAATSCTPNLCPQPTGSCCLPDGSCLDDVEQVDCLGQWRGDGSTCAGHGCPPPLGACCFDAAGGCQQLTNADCTAAGGTPWALDVACSSGICDPVGACCIDGRCENGLTSSGCDGIVGSWDGPGTTCPGNCPITGACCFTNGDCIDDLLEAGCLGMQGSAGWSEGLTCGLDVTCRGACCVDESCAPNGTVDDCDALTGTYLGNGISCDPVNPCIIPQGACCQIDGTCSVARQVDCESGGGVYDGDDTLCDPNPCPQPTGACCFTNGDCNEITEEDCATNSGVYSGHFTVCTPNPCPQPTGACCSADGSCNILTVDECTTALDTYQGDDTVCDPSTCPQPTGACCSSDGACSEITEADCTTNGGIFSGNFTTCDLGACPQPGACCLADGTCPAVNLPDECVTLGGTHQGDGTVCEPNTCPQPTGACCLEGVCNAITSEDCAAAGGAYEGDFTVCDPNPCPQPQLEACCQPDATCTNLLAASCTAVGGEVVSGQTCEEIAACPIRIGACCNGASCTPSMTEEACTTGGGNYQGDATDCTGDPCQVVIVIESSTPPSGAIDARQPNDLDGTNPSGWDSVEITFNVDPGDLLPTDFTLSFEPVLDPGPGPAIMDMTRIDATTFTIGLSGPIPPAHWTQVTHIASGSSMCLGYLPADVNSDGGSGTLDILRIIDCLNGVQVCALYQGDVDRSAAINSQDILRVIDLLNGAGSLGEWNGVALPTSPCAPPSP